MGEAYAWNSEFTRLTKVVNKSRVNAELHATQEVCLEVRSERWTSKILWLHKFLSSIQQIKNL